MLNNYIITSTSKGILNLDFNQYEMRDYQDSSSSDQASSSNNELSDEETFNLYITGIGIITALQREVSKSLLIIRMDIGSNFGYWSNNFCYRIVHDHLSERLGRNVRKKYRNIITCRIID